MRVFVRKTELFKGEAWVEEWLPGADDWKVVSSAKFILASGQCLIDTIDTPPKFQRRGYASAIVRKLQETFKEVAPIGVKDSAVSFWEKFGMKDAGGKEL